MTKIYLGLTVIFFLSGFSGCGTSTEKNKKNVDNEREIFLDNTTGPVIEFVSQEHNFGKVNEGEKLGWYFKYKNVGDSELIITKSHASCGCTVPNYSKEPLPSGKEGFIRVVFDTSGRAGIQTKNITIESNAQNNVVILKIIAEIVSN